MKMYVYQTLKEEERTGDSILQKSDLCKSTTECCQFMQRVLYHGWH